MTEDQKYQGALYKDKSNNKKQKNNNNNNNNGNSAAAKPQQQHQPAEDPKAMHQQAYVEDIGEDRAYESGWDAYEGPTEDEKSPAEPLPEAPTPPSATAMDDHVNVFDFLVATGQTPNASTLNLPQEKVVSKETQSTSLVRYEYSAEEYLDAATLMEDDEPLVSYGSDPVPSANLVTPTAKTERKKTKDSDIKKDKKRKRLHLDIPGDHPMTDAPPVLHSGLTGGLNKLMRPVLPPSPDYSGNDNFEPSPASPLKKTKSKHTKNGQITNSLFGMLSGTSKMKTKTTKTKKSSSSKSKKSSSRHKEDKEPKEPKLIEYRPHSKDGKTAPGEGQMIVYKPRADVFLSFVNKGPESERGCSMNKALKRFHRERQASGSSSAKAKEEKELFKSLRLRRNERGEIVVFSDSVDLDAIL
jgi:cell growth-regulating nucleolar protein